MGKAYGFNAKKLQRIPNSKFNDLMSRKKGIQSERYQLVNGLTHVNSISTERLRPKANQSPIFPNNSPKLPPIFEQKGYDTTFYPEEVRISLQSPKKNPYLQPIHYKKKLNLKSHQDSKVKLPTIKTKLSNFDARQLDKMEKSQ